MPVIKKPLVIKEHDELTGLSQDELEDFKGSHLSIEKITWATTGRYSRSATLGCMPETTLELSKRARNRAGNPAEGGFFGRR